MRQNIIIIDDDNATNTTTPHHMLHTTVPYKQKVGILTGISFQLALGVFSTPHVEEEEYDVDD
jgi:hypothetical protein